MCPRLQSISFAIAPFLLMWVYVAEPVKAENPDHVKQLRETKKCRGCDLSGANLTGLSLAEADLSGSNLSHAKLGGPGVIAADLRYANLQEANLSGADLRGSLLEGANLSNANLETANLGGTYLRSANLTGANLQRANLSEADLRNARIAGAKVNEANLTGTIGLEPTMGVKEQPVTGDVSPSQSSPSRNSSQSGGNMRGLPVPSTGGVPGKQRTSGWGL